MEVLVVATALAVLVESITEYIGGIWWQPGQNGNRVKLMSALAAVLGVLACLTFQVDLIATLGIQSPFASWPGQILTGLIISRGSDFVHSIFKRIKPA